MPNYSRIFGSQYPNELLPEGTKKDIDNSTIVSDSGNSVSVKDFINEYYRLMEAGKVDEANSYYKQYETSVKPYMINAEYFNRLEEEIYNVSLGALEGFSLVVSKTEPAFQTTNSIWLKEF